MNEPSFIGRKDELKDLQRFLKKSSASLIVVKGRRRIGKSRLIEEFIKPFKHYLFAGIAPTKKPLHNLNAMNLPANWVTKDFLMSKRMTGIIYFGY